MKCFSDRTVGPRQERQVENLLDDNLERRNSLPVEGFIFTLRLAHLRENFSSEVNFMKRFSPLQMSLSLALVAVLAAGVMAQDTGGRRGGPGGGPGGPGGGRPGGGGFGGGGDPIIGLLMSEEVREEIELMPDQEEALTKLRESASSGFDRSVDIRSMSEEDRAKFFAEAQEKRKKMETEMREKLEEVLLPEQLERLEQISIQVRGAGALADPELAAKLKVTEDQKTKMEEVRTKSGERMREVFSSGGGDREKMREAFAKMRKEIDDEVLAVLSADQRKEFEEMKGKPFELPEGGLGGRGGFGGGPGGPGGFGGGRPGGDTGGDRPRRRPTGE